MAKDTRKIIQALAYLASKQKNKTMGNMKAYKLLWLADRYHLNQTGRTITGDTYYAMPYGIVPSDAKCILENTKTKLYNPRNYKEQFICGCGEHKFRSISEPDINVFSDSDQDALDKVLAIYGDYNAKQLSELSHKFPEWTFYQDLIEDKERKSSYKIDFNHFFEDAPVSERVLFEDNPELISLTKELYYQYNYR